MIMNNYKKIDTTNKQPKMKTVNFINAYTNAWEFDCIVTIVEQVPSCSNCIGYCEYNDGTCLVIYYAYGRLFGVYENDCVEVKVV